jgi:hypothetical protein
MQKRIEIFCIFQTILDDPSVDSLNFVGYLHRSIGLQQSLVSGIAVRSPERINPWLSEPPIVRLIGQVGERSGEDADGLIW